MRGAHDSKAISPRTAAMRPRQDNPGGIWDIEFAGVAQSPWGFPQADKTMGQLTRGDARPLHITKAA